MAATEAFHDFFLQESKRESLCSLLTFRFLPDEMARLCEGYAADILAALISDGTDAVFEEFLYWSKEDEKKPRFKRYMIKEKDRQQNYLRRSALTVCPCPSRCHVGPLHSALWCTLGHESDTVAAPHWPVLAHVHVCSLNPTIGSCRGMRII
eukprot:SAG11_NODE_2155_length_3735_cov_2.677668_1_plen_152_part_00